MGWAVLCLIVILIARPYALEQEAWDAALFELANSIFSVIPVIGRYASGVSEQQLYVYGIAAFAFPIVLWVVMLLIG